MTVYEKCDTLMGSAIHYKKNDESEFSLSINKAGILLYDGISEISIEIGEEGETGNHPFTKDVDGISEKETHLIYEIALYQYAAFKQAQAEEAEEIE